VAVDVAGATNDDGRKTTDRKFQRWEGRNKMNSRSAALDFSGYIAERTKDFAGREWVFAKIDAWLASEDAQRIFLLTGNPGCGKTAVAARLVQMSLGKVASDPYLRLGRDSLACFHFCQTNRDATLNPLRFVEALSRALANRHGAFRDALLRTGDGDVTINATQTVTTAASGSQVQNVVIDELRISAPSARSAFDRVVRIPLEALAASGFDQPLVVLLDSLDEALTFPGEEDLVNLLRSVGDLRPQIRFILTSRPDKRVATALGEPTLDLIEDAPADVDDVRTYVEARLGAQGDPKRMDFARSIAKASQGNFLYARYKLDEAIPRLGKGEEPSAIGLPEGLDGIYREFLQRELASNLDHWEERYRPVLGLLAVARGEGLTGDQIARFSRQKRSQVDGILRRCEQFLAGPDDKGRVRLYHQSFRDFLLKDADFHVYPDEANAGIADYYWQAHHPDWQGCDTYGLDSLASHLYHGGQSGRLYELISKNWMMARHETGDYAGFVDDVNLAWQAAIAEGEPAPLVLARLGAARRSVGEDTQLYGDVELKTLVWLNRTRKALNLARLRSAPLGRSNGLLAIYAAMQAQGQADTRVLNEAYEVVRGRQGGGEFRELVAALVDAGRYDDALECADAIQTDSGKAAALYAVSTALARTGDHDRAQEIASSIQSGSERAGALSEITAALAQAGKYDRAQAVACTISDDAQRTTALVHLASALIRTGLEDKALETLRETPALADAEDRVPVQIDLSRVLGGEDEREAEELVAWAVQGNWWEVEYVGWLSELAAALDATGGKRGSRLFEGAQRVADSIPDEWEQRPAALHTLAEHLARARRFEEAVDIACSIKPDSSRMVTLRYVVEALASTDTELSRRLCTEALKCSVSDSSDPQRYEALCELVVNMPPVCHDQARSRLRMELETAHSLQDQLQQRQALSYLVAALAYIGDGEAKEIFSEVLEMRRYRAPASVGVRDRRRALVKALADRDHLAEAEDLARLIWDTNKRSMALLIVAVPLVLAEDPHGEELFSEVEHTIKRYESRGEDRPWRPGRLGSGRMARYANLLRAELLLARLEIMILDGRYDAAEEVIGSLEEVGKSMRSYWRGVKARRQYAIALVKAGHAQAESAIAEATAAARRYYQMRDELDPLCQMAIDLAQAGDARASVALDEAIRLYRRSRYRSPLDRAEVRRAYAAFLAHQGDTKASRAFEQARKAVGAIPNHQAKLRAELLCKLVADLADSGGDGVGRLFEEARQTVDALGESAGRPELLSRLASVRAQTGRLPEAFDTLEPRQRVDRFVEDLAKWAPFFEQQDPGLALAVLCEATSVAGWLWPSWRKIHQVLLASRQDDDQADSERGNDS
jgi:hypothetical protein